MSKNDSSSRVPSVLTFYLESKKVRNKDTLKAIDECRADYARNRTGHAKRQRAVMVEGYEHALTFADDPELMEEFHARDYFKKAFKHARKPKRILWSVMFYLMNVEAESTDYDTACTYAVALLPAFNEMRDPEEVAEMLDGRGIDELHDEGVAWKRREAEGRSTAIRPGDEADGSGDKHNELEGEFEEDVPFGPKEAATTTRPLNLTPEAGSNSVSEPANVTKAGRGSRPERALPRVPASIDGPFLIVEAEQDRMDRVFNMSLGEKLLIVVTRFPDEKGFKRIVATGVRSFKKKLPEKD